jgi:two-component system sensor histidine kinase BarA
MKPFPSGPCRLSIHRQILAIALAPALVVTSLLVFVVYQGNLQHNRWLLDQHGQLLAAQLAGALEYGLATGALDQLPAIVDATVQPATAILGTPVRDVIVTDPDGRTLYRRPAAAPTAPAPEALADLTVVPVEEDRVRFAAPVLLRPLALSAAAPVPRRLGEVVVELSVAVAQAQWQRRLVKDLGLVLLTFAGAAGLAHGTGRRLSSAIRRIAAAMERIKGGDFTTRVRHTDRHELGTLQEGVNLLADTLARGKAHLDQELAKARGEYQQALDALQVQTQAAEQANQAKSLFLAKVSHEMRTPLYSIQGLVESLLKTTPDEAEAETLHTILAAAHTLYRHISDILDYTQLEKGKYAPTLAPLAVWDELETIVAPLEPLLVPRGLYLDVVVAPDVPATLACDGKAFRAILTNLFSNAVKFTERGGLVVTLEVVAPTGGVPATPWALRVGVTDTGCGIPADRWEAIFAPFEQVDEALNRRHAGTGLGLSIVKGYTDLLGGRITVASTLDRGSTFTVELPLHPVDEPPSVRPPTADALPAGLRALVVDERASFRAAVAARLTRLGIAVEAHAIPWTALVAAPLPENPHDLLIVQNLATPSADPGSIAGLRGRAEVLVALETRYDAAVAQRLQDAGSILALWSGATCARWRAALARVFRDTDASAAAPARSAAALPLAGQTVLVVEDYAINRTIMAHQLRGNGARVLEAGDGDAAVALAAEPGLDLILMDIQMPGKDGIAAIQEIRRWPAGARLPILGFTASADKPTHQRILRAGADGVLTKPLGEADLVRAVRRALRRNRPAFPIPGEG